MADRGVRRPSRFTDSQSNVQPNVQSNVDCSRTWTAMALPLPTSDAIDPPRKRGGFWCSRSDKMIAACQPRRGHCRGPSTCAVRVGAGHYGSGGAACAVALVALVKAPKTMWRTPGSSRTWRRVAFSSASRVRLTTRLACAQRAAGSLPGDFRCCAARTHGSRSACEPCSISRKPRHALPARWPPATPSGEVDRAVRSTEHRVALSECPETWIGPPVAVSPSVNPDTNLATQLRPPRLSVNRGGRRLAGVLTFQPAEPAIVAAVRWVPHRDDWSGRRTGIRSPS